MPNGWSLGKYRTKALLRPFSPSIIRLRVQSANKGRPENREREFENENLAVDRGGGRAMAIFYN